MEYGLIGGTVMEYGLIGEKLGHSYSPLIHTMLATYRYELREIAPAELDDFLTARDFRGLNVTIPYKKAVIPYCATLSDTAREVGSVNTLIKRADGTLYGHNTDIGGLICMLRGAGIDPAGRKAVILGSGGSSLTARAALRRLGAREIVVVSRSGPVDYDALYREHADAQVLINTTPVGMYPGNGQSPVVLSRLPRLCGVADMIYNPEKTALAQEAEARGIPCVTGLAMLVAQAREAAELFTGSEIPESRDREVIGAIRRETANLILIGMPGSGKSSIGRAAARELGRRFVDCDEEIERQAGMTIPEIFARYGEARFREIEQQTVAAVCRESGRVIATGGGAVLREENVRAMRQNGRLCLLQRPLESLARDGRPLSSSGDTVQRLWQERRERYLAAADFTVENLTTREAAVQAVKEAFYEAAGH